jgi:hypothetical protein
MVSSCESERRGHVRTVCLAALLIAIAAPTTFAQRPAVMTTFRHAGSTKLIISLDWIGLYDQLPPYAQWWKDTGACAGIPLPQSRTDSVQFYFINAEDFAPLPSDKKDRMMAAVTYAAQEQIYISVLRLRDERFVRHEMLHQLLYWYGEPKWDDDDRAEFAQCGLRVSQPAGPNQ